MTDRRAEAESIIAQLRDDDNAGSALLKLEHGTDIYYIEMPFGTDKTMTAYPSTSSANWHIVYWFPLERNGRVSHRDQWLATVETHEVAARLVAEVKAMTPMTPHERYAQDYDRHDGEFCKYCFAGVDHPGEEDGVSP